MYFKVLSSSFCQLACTAEQSADCGHFGDEETDRIIIVLRNKGEGNVAIGQMQAWKCKSV